MASWRQGSSARMRRGRDPSCRGGRGIRTDAQQPSRGRPLAIEDYYRIQTVAAPAISPNGRWVVFTVSTRIEDDNSTRTETFVVARRRVGAAARASRTTARMSRARRGRRQPARIRRRASSAGPSIPHEPVHGADQGAGAARRRGRQRGHEVDRVREGEAAAEDRAQLRQRLREAARRAIQGRHLRLEGLPARRRAVPCAEPARAARRPQIVVQADRRRRGEGARRLDLRPADIVWHPNGELLAFTADADWRDELKYGNATLWTVTTDGKVTRLTDDDYVYGDVEFSPDGRYLSYARTFGTDMIIEQKLNHGGSRDLFVRPVDGGEPINLTAKWDLEPGDPRWSPDGRFIYFTAGIGGETHLFRASVPGGAVEQVTKGERRLGGVTIDKRVHDDRLHRRRARRAAGRLRREHRRHRRAAAERRAREDHVRDRVQQGRAAPLAEQRRHADRRLADVPVRLRGREGAVSADRHQPRRPARGDRLQLRLQEAVLRRQRLLRARHQLPQLDRLRRRVQVGDVGRVGQQGRRGRDVRASTTSSSAIRSIRSASATPATRTAAS